MVEKECIEVDGKQFNPSEADSGGYPKLSSRQFLAMIDTHHSLRFMISSRHLSILLRVPLCMNLHHNENCWLQIDPDCSLLKN
jgi:hypothetical protein